MTKLQLVKDALSGKIVERTPASFWLHFPKDQSAGQACIDAHLDFLKRTDVDFLKIMNDGLDYKLPEGVKITCGADWRQIKPQGKDSTYVREAVERVKAITAAVGDEVATFYTVFAPVTIARHHVVVDYFQPYKKEIVKGGDDDELLRKYLAEDEEAVLQGLDAIAEDTATLIRAVIEEGGATGVFISIMSGEIDRFSREEYFRWVRPTDLKIIEAANAASDYNIVHYCGYTGVPNDLQRWLDYPAKVVNWHTSTDHLDPAQAREVFGSDKILLGGMDNGFESILFKGTEEEIRAEVTRLVTTNKDTPFVLGADCTVPPMTDWEHIRWAVDAARRASAGH